MNNDERLQQFMEHARERGPIPRREMRYMKREMDEVCYRLVKGLRTQYRSVRAARAYFYSTHIVVTVTGVPYDAPVDLQFLMRIMTRHIERSTNRPMVRAWRLRRGIPQRYWKPAIDFIVWRLE